MTLLKILFNALATAAFAAVVAGILSFVYSFASKPNEGAVGTGVGEAFIAAVLAGIAGAILGVVGTWLFPASYFKYLVIAMLLVGGLALLGWRVLIRGN
ncbi:hypothetical protein F183_A33570 [Bryobacterales bacterium F-183]|nr:hypothetical protein F183_A33570 [Bryobacterales bacterium F-183]